MNLDLLPLLLGCGAALLVGLSKTGMPGVAIPAVAMMALAFGDDTRLSVGALLPVLLVGDLFAITAYRRHAQWNRLWQLAPYVVAGMAPGFLVLAWIDSGALRVFLGVLILLLLTLEVGRRRIGWLQMPHRWWFTAAMGALAGFGTAVGNAAGPAMSIYLVSQRFDKQKLIGTAAWFFFLVNASKIPVFLGLGMITGATLGFDLILLPMVILGAIAGLYLLPRIPQRAFDTIVLILAGVAALCMIFLG